MPLFRIYRSGYHEKNNPEQAGGPETVMVGEIRASSEAEALDKAFEAGITSYPGQRVWVERVEIRTDYP